MSLQVTQTLRCVTERAARNRLGKLPDDLNATYHEIYSDIDEYDRDLADSAFKWVMCACAPLSSRELLFAIRLDSEQGLVASPEKIDESQLLHLCKNLLVLDSQQKVWRFRHLSVMEYFEKFWSLRQAHRHAAKVCLRLFIETYNKPKSGSVDSLGDKHDYESKTGEIFNPKYPLPMYFRRYWRTHVQAQQEQDVDPALDGLLETFRKILGPFGAFIEENRDEEYENFVAKLLLFKYPNLGNLSPGFRQLLIDSFVYRYYRIKYQHHQHTQLRSRRIEQSEPPSPAPSSIKLSITLTGPPRVLQEPIGKNREIVETVETHSKQKTKFSTVPLPNVIPEFPRTVVGEPITPIRESRVVYPYPKQVGEKWRTCPFCFMIYDEGIFDGVGWR